MHIFNQTGYKNIRLLLWAFVQFSADKSQVIYDDVIANPKDERNLMHVPEEP